MSIKLLRLKSGEDIVADIDENEDTVTIENPAQIMPMGDPRGGNVQMGFGPWVPFSDDKQIEIGRDWIVFITEPAKDIVNNYRQAFGSGIVVPDVKVDPKALLKE
jgi:hypothetical protein